MLYQAGLVVLHCVIFLPNGVHPAATPKNRAFQWPNATIPYRDRANLFEVTDMMPKWEEHTCIVFRKRRGSKDKDFLDIIKATNGDVCEASVGYHEGWHAMKITENCDRAAILHELGHIIGLVHEHNRPDRNNFTTVLENNIETEKKDQFKLANSNQIEMYGVPYDFNSIMHYSAKLFSKNGKNTIETNDPAHQHLLENRGWLTFRDIKTVNLAYECGDDCPVKTCPGEGFVGKDCQCWCPDQPVKICDSCSGVVCENGGRCEVQAEGFMCVCRFGFTGTNCEISCVGVMCENGGVCVANVCQCPEGFAGTQCETVIDSCYRVVCENNGSCRSDGENYSCVCQPGYEGEDCETEIEECLSVVCENGGSCVDLVNGYLCRCTFGYGGTHCEQEVDPCEGRCENGGTCIERPGGNGCLCTLEYKGDNCEIAVQDISAGPDCAFRKLSGHTSGLVSSCPATGEGGTGVDFITCLRSACDSNTGNVINYASGNCQITNCGGSFVTVTSSQLNRGLDGVGMNVWGRTKEVVVGTHCVYRELRQEDDRVVSSCNMLDWIVNLNDFDPFDSSLLDASVPDQPDPGYCLAEACNRPEANAVHIVTAVCQFRECSKPVTDTLERRLTGMNVWKRVTEIVVRPGCVYVQLREQGQLQQSLCKRRGSKTAADIRDCLQRACDNPRATTVNFKDTSCDMRQCDGPVTEITARLMEKRTGYNVWIRVGVSDCDGVVCRNGGTCLDMNMRYKCICPEGYFGRSCEKEQLPCKRRPCGDHGLCTSLGRNYRCDCRQGFTGRNCDIGAGTDHCAGDRCYNGGTCIRETTGFLCECPEGYSRPDCFYHTFVGCYMDYSNFHMKSDMYPVKMKKPALTHASCIMDCRARSYPYAGLQSNTGETPLCSCGYTFGKFGSATTCNVPCPGNSSEICGGKGVNTVLRSGFKTMVQKFVGCFRDNGTYLQDARFVSRDMTIELCIQHCTNEKFLYAALQNGNRCLCGHKYNIDSEVSAREKQQSCNTHCSGNRLQKCGSIKFYMVYETNLKMPPW